MEGFGQELAGALRLIMTGDAALWSVVGLSLYVSVIAVIFAAIIGLPLGAALAVLRFPGHKVLRLSVDALMGLPPVVVGLIVYVLLSRSGPFGVLNLLYTPTAMIIAQVILVTPIIAALTRQAVATLAAEYKDQLASFGLSPRQTMPTLLWDARPAILTAVLAGFGRAIAEVGAVMIVGGNIAHVTRVMTTTIALETSKGNLALALALGAVLLMLAMAVTAAVSLLAQRHAPEGAA